MELDELKIQLQQHLNEQRVAMPVTDIGAVLHSRSRSAIANIKRSIGFEIVCYLLFIVTAITLALLSRYWSLQVYGAVAGILSMVFVVILLLLLRKIRHFDNNEVLPVQENLVGVYNIVNGYVKRSFRFSLLLLPVCMAFCFWLGYREPLRDRYLLEELLYPQGHNLQQVIVRFAIYATVVTIIIYYCSQWWMGRLYGKYLQELKRSIADLQSGSLDS